MNQKKKISTIKLKYLNLLLIAIALIYLGFKFHQYHQQNYGSLFIEIFEKGNRIYLTLAVILVILNYGIEALKWKYLLSPLQDVTWYNAFKSVLSGTTLSVFTPNRTGEVIGKVIYLDIQEKMKAALLNFSGSMAQMICTCLFGLWGLILYLHYFGSFKTQLPALPVLYTTAGSCTLIAFMIYFNQQKFFLWLSKKKWAEKMNIRFTGQQQFNSIIQLKVLLLSALRYAVFSTQLALLLKFCLTPSAIFQLLLLSTVFFLVIWFLPSFAIAELGVRGSVAIFLFEHVSTNVTGALLPAITLWIINVALPALAGCVYLFLFTKRNNAT
jgi:hypothetical protein